MSTSTNTSADVKYVTKEIYRFHFEDVWNRPNDYTENSPDYINPSLLAINKKYMQFSDLAKYIRASFSYESIDSRFNKATSQNTDYEVLLTYLLDEITGIELFKSDQNVLNDLNSNIDLQTISEKYSENYKSSPNPALVQFIIDTRNEFAKNSVERSKYKKVLVGNDSEQGKKYTNADLEAIEICLMDACTAPTYILIAYLKYMQSFNVIQPQKDKVFDAKTFSIAMKSEFKLGNPITKIINIVNLIVHKLFDGNSEDKLKALRFLSRLDTVVNYVNKHNMSTIASDTFDIYQEAIKKNTETAANEVNTSGIDDFSTKIRNTVVKLLNTDIEDYEKEKADIYGLIKQLTPFLFTGQLLMTYGNDLLLNLMDNGFYVMKGNKQSVNEKDYLVFGHTKDINFRYDGSIVAYGDSCTSLSSYFEMKLSEDNPINRRNCTHVISTTLLYIVQELLKNFVLSEICKSLMYAYHFCGTKTLHNRGLKLANPDPKIYPFVDIDLYTQFIANCADATNVYMKRRVDIFNPPGFENSIIQKYVPFNTKVTPIFDAVKCVYYFGWMLDARQGDEPTNKITLLHLANVNKKSNDKWHYFNPKDVISSFATRHCNRKERQQFDDTIINRIIYLTSDGNVRSVTRSTPTVTPSGPSVSDQPALGSVVTNFLKKIVTSNPEPPPSAEVTNYAKIYKEADVPVKAVVTTSSTDTKTPLKPQITNPAPSTSVTTTEEVEEEVGDDLGPQNNGDDNPPQVATTTETTISTKVDENNQLINNLKYNKFKDYALENYSDVGYIYDDDEETVDDGQLPSLAFTAIDHLIETLDDSRSISDDDITDTCLKMRFLAGHPFAHMLHVYSDDDNNNDLWIQELKRTTTANYGNRSTAAKAYDTNYSNRVFYGFPQVETGSVSTVIKFNNPFNDILKSCLNLPYYVACNSVSLTELERLPNNQQLKGSIFSFFIRDRFIDTVKYLSKQVPDNERDKIDFITKSYASLGDRISEATYFNVIDEWSGHSDTIATPKSDKFVYTTYMKTLKETSSVKNEETIYQQFLQHCTLSTKTCFDSILNDITFKSKNFMNIEIDTPTEGKPDKLPELEQVSIFKYTKADHGEVTVSVSASALPLNTIYPFLSSPTYCDIDNYIIKTFHFDSDGNVDETEILKKGQIKKFLANAKQTSGLVKDMHKKIANFVTESDAFYRPVKLLKKNKHVGPKSTVYETFKYPLYSSYMARLRLYIDHLLYEHDSPANPDKGPIQPFYTREYVDDNAVRESDMIRIKTEPEFVMLSYETIDKAKNQRKLSRKTADISKMMHFDDPEENVKSKFLDDAAFSKFIPNNIFTSEDATGINLKDVESVLEIVNRSYVVFYNVHIDGFNPLSVNNDDIHISHTAEQNAKIKELFTEDAIFCKALYKTKNNLLASIKKSVIRSIPNTIRDKNKGLDNYVSQNYYVFDSLDDFAPYVTKKDAPQNIEVVTPISNKNYILDIEETFSQSVFFSDLPKRLLVAFDNFPGQINKTYDNDYSEKIVVTSIRTLNQYAFPIIDGTMNLNAYNIKNSINLESQYLSYLYKEDVNFDFDQNPILFTRKSTDKKLTNIFVCNFLEPQKFALRTIDNINVSDDDSNNTNSKLFESLKRYLETANKNELSDYHVALWSPKSGGNTEVQKNVIYTFYDYTDPTQLSLEIIEGSDQYIPYTLNKMHIVLNTSATKLNLNTRINPLFSSVLLFT